MCAAVSLTLESITISVFNWVYWEFLPLASAASAMVISQTSCMFAYFFALVLLREPPSLVRFALVLLCFGGVCVMAYGDSARFRGGEGSSSAEGGSGSAADSGEGEGSMEGDLLLLIPAAFNALYAVEWKRLVPGVEARDSLVGLGLLAFWHLVFWVWGFFLLNALGWEVFELPDRHQTVALAINAVFCTAGNFFFVSGAQCKPASCLLTQTTSTSSRLTCARR